MIMLARALLIGTALVTSLLTQAQGWQQAGEFSGSARDDAAAFALDGAIYYGTGRDAGFAFQKDFYRFDPATGTWSAAVPELPALKRQYTSVFTIRGVAYVVGGEDENSSQLAELWAFDPVACQWVAKARFPGTPRQSGVAFAAGDAGYYGLGWNNDSVFADFWRYDPDLDRWFPCAEFPGGPRYEAAGTALEQNGYVGWGRTAAGRLCSDWWHYQSLADAWVKLPDPPGQSRFYAEAVAFGNTLMAGGGFNGTEFLADFQAFDPANGTWQKLPDLPEPLRGYSAVRLGQTIYLLGGMTTGNKKRKTIWRWVNGQPAPHQEVQLGRIVPNPVVDRFVVTYSVPQANLKSPVTLSVVDLSGRTLAQYPLDPHADHCALDASGLPAGTYIVQAAGSALLLVKP
ncbi:MAG: kelch repeat-containing protein [Bacteroidota bacterium]